MSVLHTRWSVRKLIVRKLIISWNTKQDKSQVTWVYWVFIWRAMYWARLGKLKRNTSFNSQELNGFHSSKEPVIMICILIKWEDLQFPFNLFHFLFRRYPYFSHTRTAYICRLLFWRYLRINYQRTTKKQVKELRHMR